ncbi:MAG: TrlF family AAA-like ATPase [Candidatus Dormibacteria bacterium]
MKLAPNMGTVAGAEFVRADLHVHTLSDDPKLAVEPAVMFVDAAIDADIKVLGITDHNRVDRAEEVLAAASGRNLLVLPGIEVTTHEGHLLALFAPEHIKVLEAFATSENLQLEADPRDGSQRSKRSILDLVSDIAERQGLAIAAHIDTKDGIMQRMNSTALASLLASDGLAALEFVTKSALEMWFTSADSNNGRLAALQARNARAELRERGLARVMSSDAHSPDKVGLDKATRTLTRLRLDDLNFDAVRNALVYSSRARCKAELTLPPSYPRIITARFSGGFLDKVSLDFSPNLTSIIGGRGSGKSTALLAVRAALGAPLEAADGDDPDDPDRMPDRTEVDFMDEVGTQRTAVRLRKGEPFDFASGAPIRLQLQGLAQDESGRLARGYRSDPGSMLRFLEQFVDLTQHERREHGLLEDLADNAADVQRTHVTAKQLADAEKAVKELEGKFEAAQKSRIEEIAKWAGLLAAEAPLLEQLERAIETLSHPGLTGGAIDLDQLALNAGVNLGDSRAQKFTEGPTGLRAGLLKLSQVRAAGGEELAKRLEVTAEEARQALAPWRLESNELTARLEAKRRELAEQGLTVQVGAVTKMSTDLTAARTHLADVRRRHDEHRDALARRKQLLDALYADRQQRFVRRKATLKKVTDVANEASGELRIDLVHSRAGIRGPWEAWLGVAFKFRTPRVERVAAAMEPRQMADCLRAEGAGLTAVKLGDEAFFDDEVLRPNLPGVTNWETIFELETLGLDDLVQIRVQEPGASGTRDFAHLSAGQQRSVLLGLMLCADRADPLVLDQPEDHLDAPYVAAALVGHLEVAKERRQVILATHSANLTVLGDAELVLPMYADAGHGGSRDPGSVDNPATRTHVCTLLEGGRDAFRRRGQRYGFKIDDR